MRSDHGYPFIKLLVSLGGAGLKQVLNELVFDVTLYYVPKGMCYSFHCSYYE
jgi:hypothetical protein